MDGLTASDVALMNRDNGAGWADSSFMWIFALLILAGGGGNGLFGGGYRPQYATQDFVQNGFNFNDLQAQNRDIMNGISAAAAQEVEVAKDIENRLQAEIGQVAMMAQQNQANQQQCCCNILRAIDGVNYNNAMNTASINANTTEQTQKILDAITGNRMADMQNQINQLQLQQAVAGVVRYPSQFSYNAGPSPFCGGCGCNV